ncbi:hypothetical protein [Bosea sp. Root381]|uniref:hypothetical protein n=1 Tax=Bosea sp. Root381 TaxID=1736524 RepID=UPI0012E35B51|nr:hypothetical protein [Bosea sp. Root381]
MGQTAQPYAEDLSNSPDAGSRTFAIREAQAQAGRGGTLDAAPTPQGWTVPGAQADQPAPGAVTAEGRMPVLTKDMPQPRNAQEAAEWRTTKQVESNRNNLGKLFELLTNPNLPANARAVGEVFLKDRLEQSKAPDSIKEFLYAKAMGWTTAKSPGDYAKEKQNADTPAIREFEYAKRNGYAGSLLDYERDKTASRAKAGVSASDQRAMFSAEDELPGIDSTISTLARARELSAASISCELAGQFWSASRTLAAPDRTRSMRTAAAIKLRLAGMVAATAAGWASRMNCGT